MGIRSCSVVSILIFIAAFAAVVLRVGEFKRHLLKHRQQQKRAYAYLKNPHCRQDSARRAELDGYHLCDDARAQTSQPPWFQALEDSCKDISVMPWFTSSLDALRQDLHKIIFAVGLVGMGFYYLYSTQVQVRRAATRSRYGTLPTVADDTYYNEVD